MKRKRELKSTEAHVNVTEDTAAFSKVDEQTLQYFKEVKGHLDEAEDLEQKSALASNALSEAKDKESLLGSDPVCSRILEALIPLASAEALEAFAASALSSVNFIELASSPCGSHVGEKLLQLLMANKSQNAQKILTSAAKSVAEKIYEFSTDRSGSHVARTLVGLAAGIDLQSLQGTSRDQPVKPAKSDGKVQKGLRAKVGLKRMPHSGQTADMEILTPIAEALLKPEFQGKLAEELPYHQYGSPFLQTILLALQSDEAFLMQIIPRILGAAGTGSLDDLANLQADDVLALMQDRTSSHLIEVIVTVAPLKLLAKLEEKFFRNHLAWLAMHPVANFVLQALLGSINKSSQMKAVVKELRGSFPELLRSKRAGVVSAALAAAFRTGTGQADLSKALSAALKDLPGNQQSPAAALFTLDLAAKLDGLSLNKRLSTIGCTILTAVLAFAKEGSAEYLDSILDLKPQQLARVGADPGGSRVLEAVMETASANAKAKKKLLKKLIGFYGTIARTPAGNFLVEKCYSLAGIKDKEAIAEDLAKAETELASSPRGMKLLLRCQVSEFKRSSESWRKHVKSAEAVQKEFADLISSPEAKASQPEQTEEGNSAALNGEETTKRKRKKSKTQDDIASTATDVPPKKRKDKSKGKEAEQGVEQLQNDTPSNIAKVNGIASLSTEPISPDQITSEPAKKKKKKKGDRSLTSKIPTQSAEGEEPHAGPLGLAGNAPASKNTPRKKKQDDQPIDAAHEGEEALSVPAEVSILDEASKDGILTTLKVVEDKPIDPRKRKYTKDRLKGKRQFPVNAETARKKRKKKTKKQLLLRKKQEKKQKAKEKEERAKVRRARAKAKRAEKAAQSK